MNSEQFHLYGMRFTTHGDLKKAREFVGQARRMQFQLGLSNVPQLHLNYPDGSQVRVLRQAGMDFAEVYVPLISEEIEREEGREEYRVIPYIIMTDYVFDDDGLLVCHGGYNFSGYYERLTPPEEFYNEYDLVKDYWLSSNNEDTYWNALDYMIDDGWDPYFCEGLTKDECYAQRYPKQYSVDHEIVVTDIGSETKNTYITGPKAGDPNFTTTATSQRINSNLFATYDGSKQEVLKSKQAFTNYTWVQATDIDGYLYWAVNYSVTGGRIDGSYYCISQEDPSKYAIVYLESTYDAPYYPGYGGGNYTNATIKQEAKLFGLGHDDLVLFSEDHRVHPNIDFPATLIPTLNISHHFINIFKLDKKFICLFHLYIKDDIPNYDHKIRVVGTVVEGGDMYLKDITDGLVVDENTTYHLSNQNNPGLIEYRKTIKGI